MKLDLERRELYLAHEVFPGGIAGASLKLIQVGEVQLIALLVFPGGIAGASLKPALSLRRGPLCSKFSPAESPGPH